MELNVNTDMMAKNVKLVEYANSKDHLIEYKYLCCNKNYQQKLDQKLKERFLNIYKYSNNDNDNLLLLLL